MRYAKPPILRDLSLDRHAVIEASAGTGKTYTLEHLVIEILLHTDAELKDILVVTFTERAANELRARLAAQLHRILSTTEEAPEDAPHWSIGAAETKKLARAAMSFDSASISTVHAFCQRVLGEHAFSHRRLFEERLVDGRAAFSRAFLDVVRARLAVEPLERSFLEAWLEERDLEKLGDLLYAVDRRRGEIHPRFDLALFERAARELSRVEIHPRALAPALDRAGLHASSKRALLERAARLGRMLEETRRGGSVARLLRAITREEQDLSGGFLRYIDRTLSGSVTRAGLLKHLLDATRALGAALVPFSSAVAQLFLPPVRAHLSAEKRRKGQFDFDDMLILLDESLDGAEGETLARRMREAHRFALVDEFQDTDEIQWRILERVFFRGSETRLVVIGDPKQAIYGFRGADVHSYLEARRRILDGGGSLVHLVECRRSSLPLVDALNVLLDQARSPPLFSGDIRYDHPVVSANPKTKGLSRLGSRLSPVAILRLTPEEGDLSAALARTVLGRRIAREIRDLLGPEGAVVEREGGPAPLSAREIFVLTRSAREGILAAKHLASFGVPYAFYKQDGLFQTPEALDARDLLLAIAEPHRPALRIRALAGPFFAAPLEALASSASPPDAWISALYEWHSLAEAKDYARLFSEILAKTGVVEREILSKTERALTNRQHIFEVLLEEAHRTRAALDSLIRSLSAFIEGRRSPEGEDGNIQRLESEREAVQIMTMHKAKGLEADVVFLFGGFDEAREEVHVFHEGGARRVFIGSERPEAAEREADEESERLLYVALTRARARLYLPHFVYADRGAEARSLRGPFRRLNTLLQDHDPALFAVEIVPVSPERSREASQKIDLSAWRPPERLLDEPAAPEIASRLARQNRGRTITSYSRLKASSGGYHPPAERPEDDEAINLGGPIEAVDLPGGPASGRFLHEMLERTDLAEVRRSPDWCGWAERPEVKKLFLEGLARHDRRSEHLSYSQALVHTALRAPLALGTTRLERGIAGVERVVREMEFLFPALAEEGRSRRAFIKGFIDVVFSHDGRVYVLDWKSDLLPAYDAPRVGLHVGENYRLQAELYTLAALKMLSVESEAAHERLFGGVVYCFVRGMEPDSSRGVYFDRPSFGEVRASEARLALAPAEAGA